MGDVAMEGACLQGGVTVQAGEQRVQVGCGQRGVGMGKDDDCRRGRRRRRRRAGRRGLGGGADSCARWGGEVLDPSLFVRVGRGVGDHDFRGRGTGGAQAVEAAGEGGGCHSRPG